MLLGVRGKRELVVSIVSLDEVLHDSAAFKYGDAFTVGCRIRDCGDAAIGIDFQKPWLFEFLGHDVHKAHLPRIR